ncbi:MAG: lactate utilization protein [Clostridia bacterium]|nr:lactate utilization protein [Clostridia bacterium]
MTEKQIQVALEALRRNRMQAHYVATAAEVVPLVKSLMHAGESVALGGSVTLEQTGVLALVNSGEYRHIDRYEAGLSPEEVTARLCEAFFADTYLTSANAITLDGELYNVDGRANRIAAIAYGPKSVIVVAGINKLVPTLEDAVARVKTIAAPRNVERLHCDTGCAQIGVCAGHKGRMTAGCAKDGLICCSYLISASQREKDRIKVILVGEELGY